MLFNNISVFLPIITRRSFIMKYFDSQPVNTGRQPEMDLFKTIAIVFMILSHVMMDLCVMDTSTANAANGGVIDYLILIVGAPCFMICMGIGMRYSRNQTPIKNMIRGVGLLTVGQLLYLFRDAFPNLIAYWATGRQIFIANSLLVIQADILTFAGLSFFLIALFKKLRLSDGAILACAFGLNLLGLLCWYVVQPPSNYLLSQVLGYFIITDAESYFPVFCNFVFVAFGYYLGGYYPRIIDKDGLSTRILLICGPFCAIYYTLRILFPFPILPEFGSDAQYSMVPATDALASCLVSLFILALLYKICKLFKKGLPGWLVYPSAHINAYYCVSFLLIMPLHTLLIATRGQLFENELIPFAYFFVVMFLCYLIIEINARTLKFDVAKLRGRKQLIFFTAVWVLTFAVIIYAYPQIDEYANMWNHYLLP